MAVKGDPSPKRGDNAVKPPISMPPGFQVGHNRVNIHRIVSVMGQTEGTGRERSQRSTGSHQYRANLTAGSLKLRESRLIAGLLLQDLDADGWQQALHEDNVLQAANPKTIRHMEGLVRGRLELLGPKLWRMVRDGSAELASQACMAAAIKHSRLLGDFLDLVLREQYRIFATHLTNKMWEDYVHSCSDREPETPVWSESTVARLRSTVFQILAQAGYIESTRTLALQTVHVADELLAYLRDNDESYVLKCMEIAP